MKSIEVIVLDLDDTICQTKWIFHKKLLECADYLAKYDNKHDAKEWFLKLETVNNRLFELFKVNPKRWVEVVDQTAEDMSIKVKKGAVEIFNQIYTTPLPYIEGVEETLQILKKRNQRMAIHTHANAEWTWRKYEWLRLDRFFDNKMIFISDENEHKTAKSWTKVFEKLDCDPKKGMVVGDSPRSDINPAMEIGVGKCVLYEGEEIWSVHQQEVPEGVIKIKNLGEILTMIE